MSGIGSIGGSTNYGMTMMRRPDPQEMFKKVDADGSGGISQAELQAVTDGIAEKSGQTLDAAQLLTQHDSNGDGSLDREEMNSLMESIRPRHEREAMLNGEASSEGQSSDTVDAKTLASYLSNAGQELVNSLISMLQQMQSSATGSDDGSATQVAAENGRQGAPPPPPSPAEMFKKVDSDGSGAISQDELQSVLDRISEKSGTMQDAKELLAANDADGNGTLDKPEMDNLMKSLGPPPPPQQTAGGSSGGSTDETLQNALASFLQNADSNSLAGLLRLMTNSTGSTTGRTVNTVT